MQAPHGLQFHLALCHMQANRKTHLPGIGECPAQQGLGTGLYTVGGEHAGDQTAGGAVDTACKSRGGIQFRQPPLLVEDRLHRARLIEDHAAAAIGRPEPDAQAEFLGCHRCRLEFRHRLAPGAIEERCNRQSRSNAVQKKLRKGITLLKGKLFRAVHFISPCCVIRRPDTAFLPAWLVVHAQNGRVEVRQRVEIDEAGAD
ncbi:hypothetical protein D3C71_636470 [compost metagenome]